MKCPIFGTVYDGQTQKYPKLSMPIKPIKSQGKEVSSLTIVEQILTSDVAIYQEINPRLGPSAAFNCPVVIFSSTNHTILVWYTYHIKINHMYVNIPYMDGMGKTSSSIQTKHDMDWSDWAIVVIVDSTEKDSNGGQV